MRRPARLLAIGIAAYLAGLVAGFPARLIVEPGEGTNIADVAGTVWHGEAALAGGDVLGWRWAPLRSLATLGFAADFGVRSDRTALTGRATLRPGSIALADVAGIAGGSLLGALFPRLPFACDLTMQVDLKRAQVGGGDQHAEGRILSDAGSCAPGNAPNLAAPVPPLLLEAGADGHARLARQGQRRLSLADFRLARDGALSIAITPAGATAFPFAVPAGGLSIDTRL